MDAPGPLLTWHNCLQGWKWLTPGNQPLGKGAPPLWGKDRVCFPFPAPSWAKLSFLAFFICSLHEDGIWGRIISFS